MWQQLIVGALVLAAAAYAVWALWPKKSRGGACCDAGSASAQRSAAPAAQDAAKEKAPRPCDRGA
jgi:FeoB-associated Cys-rich membrane protein